MYKVKGYPPVNTEIHMYVLANVLRTVALVTDIRYQ